MHSGNATHAGGAPLTQLAINVHGFAASDAAFPEISKPQPVGFFSANSNRVYEPTARQLRYFLLPPSTHFPLNLNAGLQLAIMKPDCARDKAPDHLLKFIFDNRQRLLTPAGRLNAEFVCWRGLLTVLMHTPYQRQGDWCIHVTRYKGTFYLCQRETEWERYDLERDSELRHPMTECGYKFKQYCLSESPAQKANTNAPVAERGAFVCVFRTDLAGISLLYGAKMNGVISEQPVVLENNPKLLQTLKFVDLKVRKANLTAQQTWNYNQYKARRWWCQNFLVNIRDLYVGLRSENGEVQQIDHVDVRDLYKPGVSRWTPAACTNFLQQFLHVLRSTISSDDCPYTTYELYFNAESGRITVQHFPGLSENSFLDERYAEMFKQK